MIGTVFIFALLLLLSAFFSCSEAAMLSISRLQVQQLVKQKRPGAHLVEKLKADPHRLLETLLIGNNLVNIAAAALATKIAIDAFGDAGVGIATGITTFLVIIVGEVLPKSLGVSRPSTVALIVGPLVYLFRILLSPIVFVIDIFAAMFRRLFGEPEHEQFTQDHLRAIVHVSEQEGHLKTRERVMIQNVLKLDDRNVSEVMTPRLDVFALEMHRRVDEVLDLLIAEGYTRIPVFDTKMDQMRGVVNMKDLLPVLKQGKKGLTLEQVMQPVLVVPENKKLDSVLREFQRKKAVLAIVVDEHGLFIGIVTIEDVLEELVGEIYDENDLLEVAQVQRLDGNAYLVSGKMLISDLNERYSFGLPEHADYDTVAGLLTHHLGRIPKPHEEIRFGSLRVFAEKVNQHRIVLVKVVKVEEPAPPVATKKTRKK